MKGLQSYLPSNFENDSSSPGIKPGPNAIAHNLGGMAEAADFFLRTPTLTASNFVALWPTDPKFLALIDLNRFSKCVKFQAADNILKVDFASSKLPHFHRVYLLTVCKRSSIAVCLLKFNLWNCLDAIHIWFHKLPHIFEPNIKRDSYFHSKLEVVENNGKVVYIPMYPWLTKAWVSIFRVCNFVFVCPS